MFECGKDGQGNSPMYSVLALCTHATSESLSMCVLSLFNCACVHNVMSLSVCAHTHACIRPCVRELTTCASLQERREFLVEVEHQLRRIVNDPAPASPGKTAAQPPGVVSAGQCLAALQGVDAKLPQHEVRLV